MRRLAVPILAAIMMLAPLGCGVRIHTAYDHSVTYSRFRTYSWGALNLGLPQYAPVVRAAVDKNLRSRGWELVPSGGSATLFVFGDIYGEAGLEAAYQHVGGEWKTSWGQQGLGAGWKATGYGQESLTSLGTPGGHLVIDLFDSSTHQLLQRAIAEQDMSNSQKKTTKSLGKVIKKMLKKTPKP